jgi:hypothetical protein
VPSDLIIFSSSRKEKNGRARRPSLPKNEQSHTQPPVRLALLFKDSEWPYKREAKMGRDGCFVRALKNSQLTRGDITIICETVH